MNNNQIETITQHKDGKWISVLINSDTIMFIHRIKRKLNEMSLKFSQNDIANRLIEVGINNINREQVLENPLSLWEGK
jgi:hypothetical protein